MSDVIYKVCYDGHSDNFMIGFSNLLQAQKFVDVNIVCTNKSMKVHGIVLAANSKYFEENLLENCDSTFYFGVDNEIIFPIIEFLYYGKTSFKYCYLKEIATAAKFLGINGLSAIVSEITDELPPFDNPYITYEPKDANKETTINSYMEPLQEVKPERSTLPTTFIQIPFVLNDDELHSLQSEKNIKAPLGLQNCKRGRGRPKKRDIYSDLKEKLLEEEITSQNLCRYVKLCEKSLMEGTINMTEDMVDENVNNCMKQMDFIDEAEIIKNGSYNLTMNETINEYSENTINSSMCSSNETNNETINDYYGEQSDRQQDFETCIIEFPNATETNANNSYEITIHESNHYHYPENQYENDFGNAINGSDPILTEPSYETYVNANDDGSILINNYDATVYEILN